MAQNRTISISLSPKITVTFFLSVIGSVFVLISPFLTWFQLKIDWFGITSSSFNFNGFDLSDLSNLARLFGGDTVWSRGEYALIAGIVTLVLTFISLFLISGRKILGWLLIIGGIVSLVVAIEPTVRGLGDEGFSLGIGMYLLFIGSLLIIFSGAKTAFSHVVTKPSQQPNKQQPQQPIDSNDNPNR